MGAGKGLMESAHQGSSWLRGGSLQAIGMEDQRAHFAKFPQAGQALAVEENIEGAGVADFYGDFVLRLHNLFIGRDQSGLHRRLPIYRNCHPTLLGIVISF